ncbi:MAG: hypothetical protein KatS3mg099_338 [Candidatus Parcubacteria bacterium]|nr:MAG: hypothetical protein KatS3mg099_338 [Candidatus Parcubacteria bacterium]
MEEWSAGASERLRRLMPLAGAGVIAALVGIGAWWAVGVGFFEKSEHAADLAAYPQTVVMTPSGEHIRVAIARGEKEKVLGLSYQEGLPHGVGLLLWWETPGTRRIWMREMRFAIDALWLDCEGRVVGVKENLRPESFPEVFSVDAPACGVLEIRAGEAARLWVSAGDRLYFSAAP